MLVRFQVEGYYLANWGGSLHDSVLFGPNNDAWILLSKSYFQYANQDNVQEWEKELVYHSVDSNNGDYRVSVVLRSFIVHHHEQKSKYDGWMAIGGSGGFAYFMTILQVIVMLFVGIVLNNDSKFLASTRDISPAYEPVSDQPARPSSYVPASGSAENRVY